MLDHAVTLLDCGEPDQLEAATCQLLAEHWRRQCEQHRAGFWEQEWLAELIDAAGRRAGDPGVRRLLWGLALIASPGLANVAWNSLRRTARGEEPAWLRIRPDVTADSDVQLLRDSYGLRFGLVADITGPGGSRTYLWDIDLCHGHTGILTCGYHPDAAAAAAAWRDLVGASAADIEPSPADDRLLPQVFPDFLLDAGYGEPLTDNHFHELFRCDRVLHSVAAALAADGRAVRRRGHLQSTNTLVAELAGRFRAWSASTGVDLPATADGDDIVTWMIDDWVNPGMTDDLALSCSPHRIAAFTAYLVDDWQPAERERAVVLLEPWARFCLEQRGIHGQPAGRTLELARRAAQEPELVAGDLGQDLNRPIDETTVIGPPN